MTSTSTSRTNYFAHQTTRIEQRHPTKATRRFALDATAVDCGENTKDLQSIREVQVSPKPEIPADFDKKYYVRKVRSKQRSCSRRPNLLSQNVLSETDAEDSRELQSSLTKDIK